LFILLANVTQFYTKTGLKRRLKTKNVFVVIVQVSFVLCLL
jgi:hypothetical protein